MNKTAFFISIALAVVVLLAVGGMIYTVRFTDKPVVAAADQSSQPIDPAVVQTLNEREAAYQKMIAEANARLEQAQQQQLTLQNELAALQSNQAAAAPQTNLAPEQAALIASDFLGQKSVYTVEMTAIRGVSLYKVTFSSGDIVYVSLEGQIAGSAVAQQTAFQPSTTSHRASGGGGEHEEGDDD